MTLATTSPYSEPTLDIREQIARIDKMQAELSKIQVEITKVRRDTSLAPWTVAFTGLGAGAALFAAGMAFTKLLIG